MVVVEAVLAASGLDDEGERPDHRLSFRLNTCLGACSLAPVMSIDHHLVGRVTPHSAAQRVSRLLQPDATAARSQGEAHAR
jgi:NADH:ubiquinone oxidoreductase subunit E